MSQTTGISITSILCVSTLAGIQMAWADEGCTISDSDLKLKYRLGQIKQKEYPYNFSANQHCEWTFPTEKFPQRALFIYVREMDLLNGSKIAGYIIIGEQTVYATMPPANCRLYGENISSINTTALAEFFTNTYENYDRFCSAWFISNKALDRITFRSEGKAGDVFFKRGFFLHYNYIDVRKKELPTTDGETTTIAIQSWNTKEMESQADAAEILTTSSVQACQNTQSHSQIAIIGILGGILLITIAILIFVICRQVKSSSGHQISSRSRLQGLEKHEDHTNPAYAAIDHPTNGSSRNSLPTVVYDVPTNNRSRAPTIVSVASSMSESPYQFPTSNRPVAVDEAIPEHESVEVKDVYAVVQKDRGQ